MRWIQVTAAAALIGCGAPSGADEGGLDTASMDPCERAALVPFGFALGTGDTEFTPLAEGDLLPFYQGPQGLWHVFGSFRAAGVLPGDPEDFASPDNPIVSFRVMLGDQRLGGYEDLPRPMDPAGDGWYESVGDILMLDISDPSDVDGSAVSLSADFADSCGTAVSESLELVLTYAGTSG